MADFALRGLASSAAGPSWHARIVPRHSRRPGAPHRWGGTLVRTARFNGRREDAFGFDTGLDRCPRHAFACVLDVFEEAQQAADRARGAQQLALESSFTGPQAAL